MKTKLLNNIGLKVISFVAAVIIWMIIVNVDDAVTTKTITVPVQEINADDLESVGKTYEVVSGETATFKVRGRTSVLRDLENSDFKATADLSKLSATGAVWVDITTSDKVKNVEIVSNNNVYQVATENLINKQYSVNVRTRGTVAAGYYLGNVSATPNMISISGSETKISNIKEVVVVVDVSGYSSNITKTDLSPVVYALNGDIMDTDRLTMDTKSIDVNITMLRTKSVPVNVKFTGNAHEGYVVVSKDSAASDIEIAGQKEDLDKIDSIEMVCDLDNTTKSIEETLLYKNFLPDGITLADGDLETSGVAVKVVVEPIIEKEITLSADNIALQNASAGFTYSWESEPTVMVRGAKSVLDTLDPSTIKLRCDVGNFRSGVFYVLVNAIGTKDVQVQDALYMTLKVTEVEMPETEADSDKNGL